MEQQVKTPEPSKAEDQKPESKNQWLARRLRNNYGLLASYNDGNIQRVMRNLLDIADLLEKDEQQEITTLRARIAELEKKQ